MEKTQRRCPKGQGKGHVFGQYAYVSGVPISHVIDHTVYRKMTMTLFGLRNDRPEAGFLPFGRCVPARDILENLTHVHVNAENRPKETISSR